VSERRLGRFKQQEVSAQGRSLDDLAADVVDGRLPPTDLTDLTD